MRSNRPGELAVTQEARLGDCKLVFRFSKIYALKSTANQVTGRFKLSAVADSDSSSGRANMLYISLLYKYKYFNQGRSQKFIDGKWRPQKVKNFALKGNIFFARALVESNQLSG